MTSEFDTRKPSIIIGESPKGKSKPIVIKIVGGSHQGK